MIPGLIRTMRGSSERTKSGLLWIICPWSYHKPRLMRWSEWLIGMAMEKSLSKNSDEWWDNKWRTTSLKYCVYWWPILFVLKKNWTMSWKTNKVALAVSIELYYPFKLFGAIQLYCYRLSVILLSYHSRSTLIQLDHRIFVWTSKKLKKRLKRRICSQTIFIGLLENLPASGRFFSFSLDESQLFS